MWELVWLSMDKNTPQPLRFFAYSHLPPHLQEVSKLFSALSHQVAVASNNPETAVALRKLLEAKDAAVRSLLPPLEELD